MQEDNWENGRIWGDKISNNKNNNIIRIIFQNINGFGYARDSLKPRMIKAFITETEADVYAMAEMNVNWRLVAKQQHITDITRGGWFENQQVIAGYNQRDRTCSKWQPGGTGIISVGEMALRSIRQEHDPRKIGRWVSTTYRGKDNIRLRMISVYFPNTATSYGNKKVYCQQQKALVEAGITKPVWMTFWEDLWKEIDKWIEQGEQLIIGGDWNQDVRREIFLRPFRKRNLIPAITHKHGSNGPETFNNGSKPIDEIFTSMTIKVQAAGYLEHGKAQGDHRPIWIEITKDSGLGSKLPELPSHTARRLKCHDPRIMDRYNSLLENYLRKHNFYNKLHNLHQSYSKPLTEDQEEIFEKLDEIREQGMLYAENNCRRLKMGGIRWSQVLQQAMDTIEYLKLSRSRRLGKKVSARILIRLAKKCTIDAQRMDNDTLETEINKAYKVYKGIKKNHQELRKSYLENLAEAWETKGKGKKATSLRNLIAIEEQREFLESYGESPKVLTICQPRSLQFQTGKALRMSQIRTKWKKRS